MERRYTPLFVVSLFLFSLLSLPSMTTDSESDEAILGDVPDVKEASKKASASLFTGDERLRTDFRKFSDGGDNDDGEPDFISHTDDGDIIVLFTTPRINEDLGTVNASIRVYSFPPSGMDHDRFRGSYSLADLTLERTIPLPANFTDPDGDPHFGKCLVVLHPDDWISMACGRSSHNNQLVTSMRLDFPNYNVSVPDRTGAFFAWDQHDVLQNAWFPNASWCSVSQGPAFAWDGNELVRHTPADTFVTDVCVDGTASFPNGNASCAVTQTKCRILVEFNRTGHVLNHVYSVWTGNTGNWCAFHSLDVTISGYIEFRTSYCDLYHPNGTRFATLGNYAGGDYIVLNSSFDHVRTTRREPCASNSASSGFRIMDIETNDNTTFFVAQSRSMACSSQTGLISAQIAYHGSNTSNFNWGNTKPAIISIGSKLNNGTLDWVYTWEFDSSNTNGLALNGAVLALVERVHGGVFWAGTPANGPYLRWSDEMDGRVSPTIGPKTGDISRWSPSFHKNGTWIESFQSYHGMCTRDIASGNGVLHPLEFGISCVYTDEDSAGIELATYDIDGDQYGHFADALPHDSTQNYDTDTDGFGDSTLGNKPDACLFEAGNSTLDRYGCLDTDGDGQSNLNDGFPIDPTQVSDSDFDGYGDNTSGFKGDDCPSVYGESNRNNTLGCPDADFDGWADSQDFLPNESSQWADTDGDGYGDQFNGFQGDECPLIAGNSTQDRYGCPDADHDGWSDDGDDLANEPTQWDDRDGDGYGDNQSAGAAMIDAFPNDSTQWNDTDGDGYGDNRYGSQGDKFPLDPTRWADGDDDGYADEDDAFPTDQTQWNDTDGDGHGDNPFGTSPDKFPDDPSRWQDRDDDGYADEDDVFPTDQTQWNDTDGDGHGDNPFGTEGDKFPLNPDRWSDKDDDGYPDEDDRFPSDLTQWNDTDSDGFGDEMFGTRGDACPTIYGTSTEDRFGCPDTDNDGVSDKNDAFASDPSQWQDSDSDGYGDSEDPFPFDPSQWSDKDGDGMGDNPMGVGADKFPDDATQWGDIDGDGYGDNSDGNDADAFITDPTQWSDGDGDGYGDNPAGRLADAFPTNPTQWEDLDGDGLGDNQNGTDADPYLDDFDNDGYNDSVDLLPKFPSPGDLDADGCPDDEDVFPSDPKECSDADGDGEGDNADQDDDNDGWSDTDEDRMGTSSFNSASMPTETFEIVVPGTSIGLGAWDIIGMFAGIPAFCYLALMISTRGPRVRRFEEDLFEARSEAELADISTRYERAMLFRLIGPHHGLRLERIRSKLENKFDRSSGGGSSEDMWTDGLDTSPVDYSDSSAPSIDMMGQISSDGYEWLEHGGSNWYRAPHSGQEWTRWG